MDGKGWIQLVEILALESKQTLGWQRIVLSLEHIKAKRPFVGQAGFHRQTAVRVGTCLVFLVVGQYVECVIEASLFSTYQLLPSASGVPSREQSKDQCEYCNIYGAPA